MNHPLDSLTRDLTAFDSFQALLDTAPQYRPTILPRDSRHVDLADAYDAAQGARGDKRRAWRGTGPRAAGSAYDLNPYGYLAVTFGGVPAGSGLYSQWLRAIHAINGAAGGSGEDLVIGTPRDSWHQSDGAWVEDYPTFQVILRYTAWGHDRNSGTLLAKTATAADQLKTALGEVL